MFGPQAEMKLWTVTVSKKDGSTSTANVVRISKSFDVDGVPHVFGTIEQKADIVYNRSGDVIVARGCSECRRLGRMCKQCEFDEYDC